MSGRSKWGRAWDTLTGRDAPVESARRSHPRSVRAGRSYASAGSGHMGGWNPGSRDPNAELFRSNSLVRTRERARDLYHSSAWGRRTVDALTNAIVSTGIFPTVNVGDAMMRHPLTKEPIRVDAYLYEAWAKWGRHPVPGSRLTIAGLQQLACRTWVKDGEFLSRIRGRQKADMPGLPPIMIEPLDAGQLPVEKTEQVGNGLNRIIGSVEIDALGEVAAYHVLNEAPGSLFSVTAGAYTTQRIVAAQMIHLFRQEDAGQLRGISLLAPIVKSIYLHDQYHEAVQVGAAVANDMSIVVNRRDVDDGGVGDGGPLPPSQARDASGNPEVDDEGRPVFEMGPGLVYQASPDETITVNKPTAPQGVSDYVRVVLKEIAAGVGLSYYTLTGDMSDASFSQAKLGLLEQGAVIACLREQTYIPGFLAPLWKAWIDAGILNGIFPNDPRLYDVTWSKPKTRSADELQDAKSNLLRLQMGLTTPTAVVEANGDDLDDILAQFKKDREAMEDAGVVPLWDLSKVSAAGNAQIIASDASESGPPPKGGGL